MIEQTSRLREEKQRILRPRQQQLYLNNGKHFNTNCYNPNMVKFTNVYCALLVSLLILLLLLDNNGGYISLVESFSSPMTSSSSSSSSLTATTKSIILQHMRQHSNCRTKKLIILQQQSKLYSYNKNQNPENDSAIAEYDDEDDPLLQTTEPKERNIMDLLFNPYSSTVIPPEIAKDIYIAEGNTIAAKERTQRILLYCIVAFISILLAFFNGFLTELRSNPPPTLPDGTSITSIVDTSNNNDQIVLLDAFGFGWVYSNIVTTFLLTNKIGGILCLLLGGATGLLAEAEYDTRRINAEKIYTELIKRRRSASSTTSKTNNSSNLSNKKAKRRSNSKEAKRLNALSEVTAIATDKVSRSITDTTASTSTSMVGQNADAETNNKNPERGETKSPNLLDRVKDFYQQADTMAMTQALLMNKQLEDQGILPKITDETGLKVIAGSASRSNTIDKESNATSTETKVEKE